MTERMAFAHEMSIKGASDDWLTPPYILNALGPFDLDPCASLRQTWPTARVMLTQVENGLTAEWNGRVWLNPPYGSVGRWLSRLAGHGDGIALTYARTETAAFTNFVWPKAAALMFLFGRVAFYRPGSVHATSGPAPSVLIAYGEQNAQALLRSGLQGAVIRVVESTAPSGSGFVE